MIAIIGGGISGLSLAHELSRRDTPFILLEASSRVGGVIRSATIDSHVLEYGPQRARLTKSLSSLVDELGLRSELIHAPDDLPLFVYARGRLRTVPTSPSEFVRSDIMTLRGRLRLMLEPLTGRAHTGESVEHCFVRKLGREAYETLAGPLYGGLYASDPAEMLVDLSLASVMREFAVRRSILLALLRRRGQVAAPSAVSFRDGIETLPRALYERHAARIRLEAPVDRIDVGPHGPVVITDAGERIDAQHVVMTVPAPAAAHMLRIVAPDASARIASLQYNPLAIAHLHADTDLRGMGYQVGLNEPLVTRGVTWNDSLFSRRGIYTAFLGGARHASIAQQTDSAVAEIAVKEFRQVTGVDARAISVGRAVMPAWDRTWAAIRSLELPPNVHVHANWLARPGLPGRFAESERLLRDLHPESG